MIAPASLALFPLATVGRCWGPCPLRRRAPDSPALPGGCRPTRPTAAPVASYVPWLALYRDRGVRQPVTQSAAGGRM